jgi:hypothetical protein
MTVAVQKRRVNLYGLDDAGLDALVADIGQPKYRAKQIKDWLYGETPAVTFEEMHNLPKVRPTASTGPPPQLVRHTASSGPPPQLVRHTAATSPYIRLAGSDLAPRIRRGLTPPPLLFRLFRRCARSSESTRRSGRWRWRPSKSAATGRASGCGGAPTTR